MYGHIADMAEAVKKGVEEAGGTTEIFQVPETLSEDVLAKLHAPPKPNYPVIQVTDLPKFDAFLFGVPTRYGNMPGQWKAFIDQTGALWASGALAGKYGGVFVSTGTPGGGQESTVITFLSTFAHHGIIYVPLGYSNAFAEQASLEELHGGSPWGSGCYAAGDGSRQVSNFEKNLATVQGKAFWNIVNKVNF